MPKNTSVTLGPHFESFIAEQISQGHFGTTSEAIRAGLKLLEERETRLETLRRALREGEDSGPDQEYSLAELIRELDSEGLGG